MDLTILIPTMNRHEFLTRTLEYYKSVKFDGYIFIGDSSDTKCLQANKDLITNIKELNLIHYIYPNPPYLHAGLCIQEMNKDISTSYVIYQGDDDLFIPSALQQCIDFLNQSSQLSDRFIAAHGKRCCVRIINDKPYGNINFIGTQVYDQNHIHDDFSHRWQQYIRRSWSSQYCIHRIDAWKKMYEKVHLVPSPYWGAEFLPCSLNAILGKTKQLDCALLVYQDYAIFREKNLFDDMYLDNWASSMRTIKQILIDNGISSDIIYSYVWFHVSTRPLTQYFRRYGEKEKDPEIINEMLNSIEIKHKFNKWSYYEAFLPIFNFLTGIDNG